MFAWNQTRLIQKDDKEKMSLKTKADFISSPVRDLSVASMYAVYKCYRLLLLLWNTALWTEAEQAPVLTCAYRKFGKLLRLIVDHVLCNNFVIISREIDIKRCRTITHLILTSQRRKRLNNEIRVSAQYINIYCLINDV